MSRQSANWLEGVGMNEKRHGDDSDSVLTSWQVLHHLRFFTGNATRKARPYGPMGRFVGGEVDNVEMFRLAQIESTW
jgi:hypothetical protein